MGSTTVNKNNINLFRFCVAPLLWKYLFSNAFGLSPSILAFRASNTRRVSTSLSTSISLPPESYKKKFNNNDDNDEDKFVGVRNKYDGTPHPIRMVPPHENQDDDFFLQYLRKLDTESSNGMVKAYRMDDELIRMEQEYFKDKAAPDEPMYAKLSYSYKGDIVRPHEQCYIIVCDAYARVTGKMSQVAARQALNVLNRFHYYSTLDSTDDNDNGPNIISTRLRISCLNAQFRGGHFKEAENLIKAIEAQYAVTQAFEDAPTIAIYTKYLTELSKNKRLRSKTMIEKAIAMYDHVINNVQNSNPRVRLNRNFFIAYMRCHLCYDHLSGMKIVKRVEGVLHELEQAFAHSNGMNFQLKPNSAAYAPLFYAVAQCKGGLDAAQYGIELLDEIKLRGITDSEYHPKDWMYTSVLAAYSKVSPSEITPDLESRIDNLIEEVQQFDSVSASAYTAVITALTASNNLDRVKVAEKIFKKMKDKDTIAYECMIRGYAKSGSPVDAERLVWEVETLAKNERSKFDPISMQTLGTCILAWEKHHNEDIDTGLERVEALLQLAIDELRYRIDQRKHNHVDHDLAVRRTGMIDSWVFDGVILFWSTSKKPNAGEKCEEILDIMLDLHNEQEAVNMSQAFIPNYTSYVLALDAWGQSESPDSAEKALNIIETMDKLHEKGFLPPINLRALSSAAVAVSTGNSPTTGRNVENIFSRISTLDGTEGDATERISPRLISRTISNVAKFSSPEPHMQALHLLRHITKLSEKGHSDYSPNTIYYNCVMDSLSKHGTGQDAMELLHEMERYASMGYDCQPDAITYSCLCRAVGQSGGNVEEILVEIENSILQSKNNSLKPDVHLYNMVLAGLASRARKHPTIAADAAKKAVKILIQMELSVTGDYPVPPDVGSYSRVCSSLAMSDHPDAVNQIERLVKRVEKLSSEGSMKPPNLDFYEAVVAAFARRAHRSHVERAESIIERLEERSKQEDFIYLRPNTHVLNLLIGSLARSSDPAKLRKCIDLLERMLTDYQNGETERKPSVYTYNSVILAAAHTRVKSPLKKKSRFDAALKIFKQLHDGAVASIANPDNMTYQFFLRACNELLPDSEERDRLIKQTLRLCIENRCLSPGACKEASVNLPDAVVQILGKDNLLSVTDDGEYSKFRIPDTLTENSRQQGDSVLIRTGDKNKETDSEEG